MRCMIQMLCDPLRGGNLLADALRQCFQTNQGKIRIERAGHRAERAQIFDADALDECLVAVSFGKTVPFTVAIIADDLLPCGELGESAIRPVKMTAIDNRAANRIAMAGNTFGGGMHDDIRTELDRPQQIRRGHGVVYDQGDAVFMRQL